MAAEDEVERWPMIGAWAYSVTSPSPRSNREVVRLADLRPGQRALDVGCGPGAAVRRAAAAGAEVTGVDPSPAMVRIATRRSRGHPTAAFVVGHAADLPLEDDSVDVAWTIAAYHHWHDPAAGLDEVHRVLAPAGRLLIGERRLRKSGGHGLSTEDATRLVADLGAHGYHDATVTEVRIWPWRMLVVEAQA